MADVREHLNKAALYRSIAESHLRRAREEEEKARQVCVHPTDQVVSVEHVPDGVEIRRCTTCSFQETSKDGTFRFLRDAGSIVSRAKLQMMAQGNLSGIDKRLLSL